jgi:HlyD family secretion protein
MRTRQLLAVPFALFFTFPAAVFSQDETPAEIKEKFFQVIESVDARVESAEMHEVTPDTKNWTALEVKWVAEEGALVKKGDVIAKFDTEEIERKIRETTKSVELAKLGLQGTEAELKQLDKTTALDKALQERRIRNAEQDYKYFVEVEKPNTEKTTQRSIENSRHALEYATEEYNQLKRMYDEDELTEESEEIVLKRTQRDVENSQFYLEQAQMRAARALEYDLPRSLEQKTDELERSRLEHERMTINLPLEREKKVIAFEKSKLALEKEVLDLTRLNEDLSRMELTAPADGVIYYGRCQRGSWVGPQGPQRDIEVGKAVANDKPLLTIVNSGKLFLRADLSEAQLGRIQNGASGSATSAAFPGQPVQVTVQSKAAVPFQADKFDCRIAMDSALKGLMPGMSCKVRIVVRENPKAILVPEGSVFTDDGLTQFVFVLTKAADAEKKIAAQFEKRTVKTGFTSDKMTEVLEGLKAGELVSPVRK